MTEETTTKSFADSYAGFDRFPLLNPELGNVGDNASVTILEEPKEIKEDALKASFKKNGKKGIAKDTLVFLCSHEGVKKEFWIGKNSFTSLRELAKIALERNAKLCKGLKVIITRSSKGDQDVASWSFSSQ